MPDETVPDKGYSKARFIWDLAKVALLSAFTFAVFPLDQWYERSLAAVYGVLVAGYVGATIIRFIGEAVLAEIDL